MIRFVCRLAGVGMAIAALGCGETPRPASAEPSPPAAPAPAPPAGQTPPKAEAPAAESPPRPEPPTAVPASPAPAAPSEPSSPAETPPFTADIEEFGVFDGETRPPSVPKKLNADEPGVHLLIRGRIRNDFDDVIHRGGVYGMLQACFGEAACRERPSSGRGFTVPLEGTAAWHPGTWRHFLVVTRPLDPVYRELEPSAIQGILQLEVRGARGLASEGELWRSDVQWQRAAGHLASGTVTVKEEVRLARETLPAGTTLPIRAAVGLDLLVELPDGGHTFVQPDAKLVPGELKPVEAPALPRTLGLGTATVAVRSMRPVLEDRQSEGKPERRWLVAQVEVAWNGERKLKCSPRNFELVFSTGKRIDPPRSGGPDTKSLDCGGLETGQSARGELAFAWPQGTRPLRFETDGLGEQDAGIWLPGLPWRP